MFADTSSFATYSKLLKLYKAGDRQGFHELLIKQMQTLAKHRDELRLLFFIGKECDEEAYRDLLSQLEHWRTYDSDDKKYRCETYLYAMTHTMPDEILAKKPFLIPLFREATAYCATPVSH